MSIKQPVFNHLKNILGWRTKRKFVVFSVDDYGNVRLDSKKARQNMDKSGLKVHSRFDAYDTLETREDLEMLYDTLTCVKDKFNHPAVFTPFALPCNIDFEAMAEENYQYYRYELLPQTFEKLSVLQPKAYQGTWAIWQEGITKGLMAPQFHGREHLNLKVLQEKLVNRDKEVLTALQNRSYTSLSGSGYSTIGYSAAFEFWELAENKLFDQIIREGLDAFETVYGYRAIQFNPPGGREHPLIHQVLYDGGIRYLDTPLIKHEHQGLGKYQRVVNWTGKKNTLQMPYQVRNVVFEPTHDRGFNSVNYALRQIEAAFFWHKPAIISSHRVNFCGHIEERNRAKGLTALRSLLKAIVQRWPDVEFVSAAELGDIMSRTRKVP